MVSRRASLPLPVLSSRDGGGSLIQPLFKSNFFNRADGTPITFFMFQNSEQLPGLAPDRRDARVAAGAIPWEDMEKEARGVGAARLGRLRDEAVAALEAWEGMANILDAKASDDPPSTSHVRDMLRQIHTAAVRYAPAPVEAAAEGGEGEGGMVAVEGGGVMGPGGFAATGQRAASREDALKMLEAIATFFRRTEPASPIAYTLDDAIRRAKPQLAGIAGGGGSRCEFAHRHPVVSPASSRLPRNDGARLTSPRRQSLVTLTSRGHVNEPGSRHVA